MKRYPVYKDSGIEWIGKIPTHWQVMPTFAIFKEQCFRNSNLLEKNLLSLSYGKIVRKDFETNYGLLPESFETYQIVIPSNIILRLTDLQNDKKSLRVGLVKEKGIITSAYLCLYPKNIDSEYGYNLLHSYDILKVFYAMGSGIRQNMSFKDLRRLPILVPPIQEQKSIAHFIDRKLEQIQHFIRNKQRLIELLNEQKTTIINRAVTKGINPHAPMKDSGIEWLGEIPAHWEVIPLTKNLSSLVDYRGKTPDKTESGIFLVTAKNIKNGTINYEISKEYISENNYFEIMRRGLPKIGDILFTTEAPLGEVANVDFEKIALAQRIIKFRVQENILNPYFVKLLMMSSFFQNQIQQEATGSTAQGIKASKLHKLKILKTSIDEQEQIVKYIDFKNRETDQAIAKAEREIELIQEYRTTIISDAVTGKIDVRSNAAVATTLTA